MLAKNWKKIFILIAVIACLMNVFVKLTTAIIVKYIVLCGSLTLVKFQNIP